MPDGLATTRATVRTISLACPRSLAIAKASIRLQQGFGRCEWLGSVNSHRVCDQHATLFAFLDENELEGEFMNLLKDAGLVFLPVSLRIIDAWGT